MSRISSFPGFTVVPNWSSRAMASRAASVLLGAFSRRLIVDCEASAAPLFGQRPIATNGILVSARDRRHTRHHHLEHCVPDAVGIAAIRHRFGKPPAHTELALRPSQQQQTGIGRLVAAVKIYCEFLAADTWKVKGKRRIVGHGGCGARLIHGAICLDNDLLRESLAWCHSRHSILTRRA